MISVITAAYDPVPEYLEAAYESVVSQKLPDSWSLEWVVQEDGTEGRRANEILPDHSLIQLGGGRKLGVSHTRNLALARAGGELIKNLDQDDVLTPGVIARDIEVLTKNADIQWVTSAALDLLEDGSTVAIGSDPPAGRINRGYLVDWWRERHYSLPVHPTTLCIRRPLAVALGGWMAIPGSDDTGLLIAASVVSPGYFHGEAGLLWRTWPGQVSASAEHTQPIEWNTRMKLISERADALAALRWSASGPGLSDRTGC
ncbi:MAG TPA: glycosyltransferase family A protein [Pseudonocardia sp.]|uniref:glycosyltransferase family 2 protein n=1 Tax=Pseudonocardia sp. TaxID=60912 RepID=UPI002C24240D|nr:glycosyltransferase family A protein [Pseudonocardia sp.]HTF52517.1 glycosyltransferase family A protein [Pseudonocardia sp.]